MCQVARSRRRRWHGIWLAAIYVVTSAIAPFSAQASEEIDPLVESIAQFGVLKVACSDEDLLSLTGLKFDECLAKAENAKSRCWQSMLPLLDYLRLENSPIGSPDKDDKFNSTAFLLEKCIQSSILLPSALDDYVK